MEGVVLAGELSELVRGIVQVLLRDLEALLEKHAFAVRGRSRELGDERVQLVDIRARQGCGSLRTVIRHVDGDDSALPVFRNRRVFIEFRPCIHHEPLAINSSQIKLLDEAVLGSLAAQYTDKQRARTLQP